MRPAKNSFPNARVCSIISFQAIFAQNEGYVPWQKPQISKGMEGFCQGTEPKFCVKSAEMKLLNTPKLRRNFFARYSEINAKWS